MIRFHHSISILCTDHLRLRSFYLHYQLHQHVADSDVNELFLVLLIYVWPTFPMTPYSNTYDKIYIIICIATSVSLCVISGFFRISLTSTRPTTVRVTPAPYTPLPVIEAIIMVMLIGKEREIMRETGRVRVVGMRGQGPSLQLTV